MTSFVLVAGSHHAGWWYEPLARRLRALGHEAFPVTLTGIGDRNHLITASTNLDTHIEDVLAVLTTQSLENAVLVGHSYGGMVITGAADRAASRVAGLVYLDAFVPADGDSQWAITNDQERRRWIDGAAADGFTVPPMPFFDNRATTHPLACFLQAIRLNGDGSNIRRRHYVYATGWEDTPFTATYNRLRDDPAWNVTAMKTRHSFADAWDQVLEVLLESA